MIWRGGDHVHSVERMVCPFGMLFHVWFIISRARFGCCSGTLWFRDLCFLLLWVYVSDELAELVEKGRFAGFMICSCEL